MKDGGFQKGEKQGSSGVSIVNTLLTTELFNVL